MSYIGKEPADSFISFAKQDFSTSATTSYTLDNAVTNENELALFINFVRQEPTTAYTASGTTLTLTSATSSSDDMYCVYLGQAKQTVNAPDGSVGTAQLASEAVTNAKVASSIITGQTAETSIATDDLILLSDTSASGALKKMTQANFVAGVGGAMTPAFATATTVAYDTERIDTDSAFDTSTHRFTVPSGKGGRYFIAAGVRLEDGEFGRYIRVYVNGSQSDVIGSMNYGVVSYTTDTQLSGIIDLSASDYIEIKVNQHSGSNKDLQGLSDGWYRSYFQGFKLIQ